ncbi:hypothetical protein [Legionella sp.]|uniref:hypothetical protein n=1 Tax=Legionella sp. TaxID=459 RepID=UPI003D108659
MIIVQLLCSGWYLADFKHYPEVPLIEHEGLVIDLMVGELLGVKAPVLVYSPLIGLDINTTKAVHTNP